MAPARLFPYEGPEDLRAPVLQALKKVVDPEVALNIVDVGLVYGVHITDTACRVRLTMTSPACPVADLILDEAGRELGRCLPEALAIVLHFAGYYYLPVVLFYVSLVLRVCLEPFDPSLRVLGAALDAAAILAFVLTLAVSALAFRRGQALQATRTRIAA